MVLQDGKEVNRFSCITLTVSSGSCSRTIAAFFSAWTHVQLTVVCSGVKVAMLSEYQRGSELNA